jgi:hypothetical protein
MIEAKRSLYVYLLLPLARLKTIKCGCKLRLGIMVIIVR